MMNLKKYFLLLATTLPMLWSCGGDDPGDEPEPPKPTVNVTLQAQSIAEGAEVDAKSTTQIELTYNMMVKVAASATLNGKAVTPAVNPKDVTGVVIPLSLEEGTAYTLTLAEGAVVASSNASAKAPAFTLHFTTKAAPAPVEPGNIAATLVNGNAEAQKLYDYMRSVYGVKTLSSVMANVNWNNDCADKVQKLTGKYPAMNCYDFIHIYVPTNNWVNYTTLAPVETWVKGGGIVQLMWHFNVPLSEDKVSAITASGGDANGQQVVTCTPSETTFKAANALVDGTWENKWFYEQMDKVADVLLQLQKAGIAATWRPFHEAAGNAEAKQQAAWTKSWFWWGYDGAETYKKLWAAMFDHFKQKGINNLIWVWTTQNYNGNSTTYNQDTAWYPGDQYVDIVARDLYGSNADQNLQEFSEIQAAYPTKMVVLGECGYGTDNNARTEAATIADCWAKGAKWGHFMVWYQGGQGSTGTMCSDAWWKSAMSDANVITREQVKY